MFLLRKNVLTQFPFEKNSELSRALLLHWLKLPLRTPRFIPNYLPRRQYHIKIWSQQHGCRFVRLTRCESHLTCRTASNSSKFDQPCLIFKNWFSLRRNGFSHITFNGYDIYETFLFSDWSYFPKIMVRPSSTGEVVQLTLVWAQKTCLRIITADFIITPRASGD